MFPAQWIIPLLQRGHRCVHPLDCQVAACHHDYIGSLDDIFQGDDRFRAFDLRHQQGLPLAFNKSSRAHSMSKPASRGNDTPRKSALTVRGANILHIFFVSAPRGQAPPCD